MISETAPYMLEELKVQYVRSNISEEQSERLMFEVFDLLLKEDGVVAAGKEDKPEISKD